MLLNENTQTVFGLALTLVETKATPAVILSILLTSTDCTNQELEQELFSVYQQFRDGLNKQTADRMKKVLNLLD